MISQSFAVSAIPREGLDEHFVREMSARLARARTVLRPAWALATARTPLRAESPYGDRTIIYASSEWYGGAPDPSCRFVGPLLGEGDFEEEPALEDLDECPLVHMSLGTLATDRPDLYRQVSVAFAEQPVNLLISVGPRFDVSQLGDVSANTRDSPACGPANCAEARITVRHTVQFDSRIPSRRRADADGASVRRSTPRCRRVAELGAGEPIDVRSPEATRAQGRRLLGDTAARQRARELGEGLSATGGSPAVATLAHELLEG